MIEMIPFTVNHHILWMKFLQRKLTNLSKGRLRLHFQRSSLQSKRNFNIILLSQLNSWIWHWPTWTRGLSLKRTWRIWNTMPWKHSNMPATRALLQIFSGAKICPNSSRYGINLNIHIEDSSTCGVSLSRNKICGICYSAGVKSDIAIPVGGRCVRFCPRRRITFSRKQPTTEISYSS